MGNGTSKLDSVAQWCMILLIGLLPIFFVPVLWITIVQAKAALIVVLLAITAVCWVAARFLEGSVRIPASLILAAGLLLPIIYATSVLVSGVSQVSLVGTGVEQDTLAFACILYAALALSALIFSGAPEARVRAIRGLYIGAAILVGLEIFHFAMPQFGFGGAIAGQTGNAFGNWHEFAIILGLFTILGLSLRESQAAEGIWRYLIWAVSLASVLLLIVANFFDVWAAVAVACAVGLAFELMAQRAKSGHVSFSWKTHGEWGVLIILAVFLMVFGSFITNVMPSQIRVASVEVRPSWQGTIEIGSLSLTEPASLFFGAGPNTFGREWGLYKPASVNQTAFWNTDFNAGVGSIPTSFVTTGIIGILVWILFVGAILLTAGRSLIRHTKAHGAPDVLYASSFGLAALYLVVFYILYVPGPALSALVFIFAGLLTASAAGAGITGLIYLRVRGEGWQGIAQAIGLILFGIVVLATSLGISRVLAAEMLLNKSIIVYNQTQDVQRASDLIKKALKVYPSNTRAHRAAVQLGLVQLQQLIAKGDPEDEAVRAQLQTTLQETIQHGLDAVAINGDDYQNWLEVAGLYQQLAGVKVSGAYENARAAYERARQENPSSPVPLFQLAQLEIIENHPDLALQNLAAAVQLKQDFAAAYYVASQIYASQNNLKDALSTAALAAQYASNDPLAWFNAGSIAYAAKDFQNAAAALERALTLEPNYANAAYVLGLTYAELGRTADSIKIFEALNTIDPNQPVVQQALANLRAGRLPVAQNPVPNR